jgi:hypothetical protein
LFYYIDMIGLLLHCGFDTLEYSWVKATIGIYMLADYSVANKRQQHTLEVVSPRSQSRRTPEAVDEAAIVLPVAHQLLPTFAQWHLTVPAIARGSLEVPVERVEAQVDGMSQDDGLRIRGHHHTRPCLSDFAPSVIR